MGAGEPRAYVCEGGRSSVELRAWERRENGEAVSTCEGVRVCVCRGGGGGGGGLTIGLL